MLSELKQLFSDWITSVVAAVNMIAARLVPQRRIEITERDDGSFQARIVAGGKDGAKDGTKRGEVSLRLDGGRADPPLPQEWQATLRGGRVEAVLQPGHVLFRALDFPKQAADFLDGMIRAQIDRVTPWTAGDAVFGFSSPEPAANDRIGVTLAATSRHQILPVLQLATALGAASAAGWVAAPGETSRIRLFDLPLQGAGKWISDLPRLLRLTLLGCGMAAAVSLVVATYIGSMLDAEQQDLQHRISQRRTALRLSNAGAGSAEALLAKRKQTTPSSVMVLEAVSRALPDTTFVTERRIEGDKVQVVGMTQDAPSLIKLIEQSPQFSKATFFAPTTRAPNESGERFHIEAHLAPYFGSGS
jgi:general secretion pathway protein L